MTAIIDGVTVIGTPDEIDILITLRNKQYNNWDCEVRDIIDNSPKDNLPPLNSARMGEDRASNISKPNKE